MKPLKEALISKSKRDWAIPFNNSNYLLISFDEVYVLYQEFYNKRVDCDKWDAYLLSEKDLVEYYKIPLKDIFELEYGASVIWKTYLELKDVNKLFKKIGGYEFVRLGKALDSNKNFSRIQ